MIKHHFYIAAFAFALLAPVWAAAQEHKQFDEHDKQVAREWYNQHQNNAPRGFRAQDRLAAEEEARLEAGRPLDKQLRRKTHSVPRDLARRLAPAPRGYEYVVVGGHVVLVEKRTYVVHDVIRLH